MEVGSIVSIIAYPRIKNVYFAIFEAAIFFFHFAPWFADILLNPCLFSVCVFGNHAIQYKEFKQTRRRRKRESYLKM